MPEPKLLKRKTNRQGRAGLYTVASASDIVNDYSPDDWSLSHEFMLDAEIVVAGHIQIVGGWINVTAYAEVEGNRIDTIESREAGGGTAIVRWLQAQHSELIAHDVAPGNKVGQAFWRAMGFTPYHSGDWRWQMAA